MNSLKKILSGVLLAFCMLCTSAQDAWQSVTPNRLLRFGDNNFTVSVWNSGWLGTMFNPKCVVRSKGFPEKTSGGGFFSKGIYHLAKGDAPFTERYAVDPSGSKIRYTLEITNPGRGKIDGTSAGTIIRNSFWKKTPFLINGKKYNIPAGMGQYVISNVREILIPRVKAGAGAVKLTLHGKYSVLLVDISKSSYAPDSMQFRIQSECGKTPEKIIYDITAERVFEPVFVLDLRKAMNMAFQDDAAGDGKGGWTDQGASNDLRTMIPGTRRFDNVEMTVVDPAKNNGKSCIALRGNARRYFPESAKADFSASVPGKHLYVMHGTAWDAPSGKKVGEIVCTFADGSKEIFVVDSKKHVGNFWQPQPLPNAAIAWRGDNDVAAIGLYLTRYPLKKSGIKSIEFKSAGSSVWMIVAASVSENPILTQEMRKIVIASSSEWIPVKASQKIVPGSILDFSGHLDAPAGKYGFTMKDSAGHLVFERNKKPVRFYGANLCFNANYIKDKAKIDFMVDSFARIGYNLVRFHHFDRDMTDWRKGDGTDIFKNALDRFDYTLAAFKKRGIYVTLDLFISRNIGKGAIPGYPKGIDRSSYKALVWGDAACRDNFLSFAKKLMTHVNPYTGVAWKDEPAIINVDLVNEDAVSWTTLSKLSKPVFEKYFKAFMAKNKLTDNFYRHEIFWSYFLTEFYPESFRGMEKELRKIGIRQMLCDQNHNSSILTMLTREPYGIIENHFYWCHPAFLYQSWGGPALITNISAMSKAGGSMTDTFKSRAFGKPYSISEWDFVSPNRYCVEGAFLIGAYSALQEWDALCRFSYSAHEKDIANDVPGDYFDIVNDPLRLLSERAGIVFFTRGDIRPSDVSIPVLLKRNHFADKNPVSMTGIVPERIGLIAKTGNVIYSKGEKITLPCDAKAAILTNDDKSPVSVPSVKSDDHLGAIPFLVKQGVLPASALDAAQGVYRSTTGEISLDSKNLVFSAISPKSEGFVLEEGQSSSGKFAKVKNLRNFGAFLAASMDNLGAGVPLMKSNRILLLHLTDAKYTGTVFRDEKLSIREKQGHLPLLVRKGLLDVTLNRDFTGFKLYPVSNDGTRLAPLPMKITGGKTSFVLDTAKSLAYELAK